MREPGDALRSLRAYVYLMLGEDWRVALAYEEGIFRRPFARVSGLPDVSVSTPRADRYTLTQSFNVLCHPREQSSGQAAIVDAEEIRALLLRGFQAGAGEPYAPIAPPAASVVDGELPPDDYTYRVSARTRWGESVAGPAAAVVLGADGGVDLAWDPVPGAGTYRVYRGAGGPEMLIAEVRDTEHVDDGSVTPGSAVAPIAATGTLGRPNRVPLWDWEGVPVTQVSHARQQPDYADVRSLSVGIAVDPRDDTRLAVAADIRMEWAAVGAVPSAANTLLGIRTRLTTT